MLLIDIFLICLTCSYPHFACLQSYLPFMAGSRARKIRTSTATRVQIERVWSQYCRTQRRHLAHAGEQIHSIRLVKR